MNHMQIKLFQYYIYDYRVMMMMMITVYGICIMCVPVHGMYIYLSSLTVRGMGFMGFIPECRMLLIHLFAHIYITSTVYIINHILCISILYFSVYINNIDHLPNICICFTNTTRSYMAICVYLLPPYTFVDIHSTAPSSTLYTQRSIVRNCYD